MFSRKSCSCENYVNRKTIMKRRKKYWTRVMKNPVIPRLCHKVLDIRLKPVLIPTKSGFVWQLVPGLNTILNRVRRGRGCRGAISPAKMTSGLQICRMTPSPAKPSPCLSLRLRASTILIEVFFWFFKFHKFNCEELLQFFI